jgi:hypothetical protein
VNVVESAERMPPGFPKRIEGVMVRVSLKDETESSSVAVTGTTAPGPETVLAPSATEHLTFPPHTVDGVRLTATLLPAESIYAPLYVITLPLHTLPPLVPAVHATICGDQGV